MHGHLVTVKISVERGTYQWMQLDGLALDKDRLKSLDAQPMQGRRSVEQDRVLANDFLEYVPDFRTFTLHQPLGCLNRRRLATQLKFGENKWLEQFQCHFLRQAALVQLEPGTHHDDRAA